MWVLVRSILILGLSMLCASGAFAGKGKTPELPAVDRPTERLPSLAEDCQDGLESKPETPETLIAQLDPAGLLPEKTLIPLNIEVPESVPVLLYSEPLNRVVATREPLISLVHRLSAALHKSPNVKDPKLELRTWNAVDISARAFRSDGIVLSFDAAYAAGSSVNTKVKESFEKALNQALYEIRAIDAQSRPTPEEVLDLAVLDAASEYLREYRISHRIVWLGKDGKHAGEYRPDQRENLYIEFVEFRKGALHRVVSRYRPLTWLAHLRQAAQFTRESSSDLTQEERELEMRMIESAIVPKLELPAPLALPAGPSAPTAPPRVIPAQPSPSAPSRMNRTVRFGFSDAVRAFTEIKKPLPQLPPAELPGLPPAEAPRSSAPLPQLPPATEPPLRFTDTVRFARIIEAPEPRLELVSESDRPTLLVLPRMDGPDIEIIPVEEQQQIARFNDKFEVRRKEVIAVLARNGRLREVDELRMTQVRVERLPLQVDREVKGADQKWVKIPAGLVTMVVHRDGKVQHRYAVRYSELLEKGQAAPAVDVRSPRR